MEAVTLLGLADFLGMDVLHEAMVALLTTSSLGPLLPSFRIRISRDHHLNDEKYLTDAFTEILRGRLSTLTREDHINLGPDIMACLSKIFEALTEHRATLCAHVPPPQHDDQECKGQERKECHAAWQEWWQNTVVKEGLRNRDPNQRPWTGREIVARLRTGSGTRPWKMNWQCSDLTMQRLSRQPNSAIIFGDEHIIEHALPVLVRKIIPAVSQNQMHHVDSLSSLMYSLVAASDYRSGHGGS